MESATGTPLLQVIRREIASRGPITFARFMDLALYHPEHGYYSRGLGGGGGRDYLTSSGLHRAYGALMARQAAEMWRAAGEPDRFAFVEFGPGEGHFACDFLRAAAGTPFARALEYVLVEASPELRRRQQERVGRWSAPDGAAAVATAWRSLEEVERGGVPCGCLFANEVLDAFPVHRVVGTPDGPREIHVTTGAGGGLEEELGPLSAPALVEFMEESAIAPANGQEIDLNLEAPRFVTRAARVLKRGWLVIVDYGYLGADLYHPARRRGTLLAYHRHRATEEFLARPGEQDLTAHVDFSAVGRAADGAGMRLLGLTNQARFLLALGALEFLEDAGLEDREAIKDLILPDRMGGVFRVMILARGEVPDGLRGLSAPWREAVPPGAAPDMPHGAAPPHGVVLA
jgi:SAM-dependent MidA family methyltransferase